MGRIRILPDNIANKIAAGEVVERPASVVKELLENALDAGAGRIRIQAEAGGKKLIQVSDDGCGMVRDDALLAFERHATSKLRAAADLLSVATLGFRGEALPAIGAVSRLELETRSSDERTGTRLEIAGGRLINVQEAGLPEGTVVTVNDLFYNTPARRKFLRAEATELSHICSLVTHYALCHPAKSFLLRTTAGELVNVSPVTRLRDRVFQLFGGEMLEELIELAPRRAEMPGEAPAELQAAAPTAEASAVEPARSEISVSGFISRPQIQKTNRNSVYLFVNRRLVRDRVLLHAIQEAYRNLLPAHCFPVALLFLEMPFEQVDVNVHPAKVEVRFRHQGLVHDFVRDALRENLLAARPISTFPLGATQAPEPLPGNPAGEPHSPPATERLMLTEAPVPLQEQPLRFDNAPQTGAAWERRDQGSLPPGVNAAGSAQALEPPANAELSELRPLGQIAASFVVAASSRGLWLIDQHAAHERILFERFLAQRGSGAVESQRLLMPYVLRLTPAQQAVWSDIAGELHASGFEIEPFGQGTLAVKAAPAGVSADDVEKLLRELMETLEKEARGLSPESLRNKIGASVACHAAIKIHTPLETRKMEWLLSRLAATRFPMSCPHGRPVILKYGMHEILKAFHRA